MCGKISKLSIAQNQLEMIPESIGQLTSLQKFDLSHNKLKTLPATVSCLRSLKELNLSMNLLIATFTVKENCLTNVPAAVLGMSSLSEFCLTGNPIDRQELLAQPALEEYLRRRFARINKIILSKVGPQPLDLRICGLDG